MSRRTTTTAAARAATKHNTSHPEQHRQFDSLTVLPQYHLSRPHSHGYHSHQSERTKKIEDDESEMRRSTYAGAEPGVNPRKGAAVAEYSHFKQECVVDVIDYDYDDVEFRTVGNAELIKMLHEEEEKCKQAGQVDCDLPPKSVRWINIGGIDWGVLTALALRYNIHSLALEDILHEQGHNHSKADYYPEHLFLRVLSHSLETLSDDDIQNEGYVDHPYPDCAKLTDPVQPENAKLSGQSPSGEDLEVTTLTAHINAINIQAGNRDGTVKESAGVRSGKKKLDLPLLRSLELKRRFTGLSGFWGSASQRQMMKIRALTRGERVNVKHEPLFIFLFKNGTLISIRPTPSLEHTEHITERLHQPDSVLRTSEDASILAESLLDLVVDRILEVIDEYQVKIRKLEHDILLRPGMSSVRSLHILSGDLVMHKRTLEPIRTMLYGLRRYDLDRCMALADNLEAEYGTDDETESESAEMPTGTQGKNEKAGKKRKHRRKRGKRNGRGARELDEEREGGRKWVERERHRKSRVEGYLSYKAKVYLADVNDHMDFALTSLDMFSGISENLINYAFNLASYEMNEVMRRLTLATIIFLPLTLLTGYFGMNFTPFWSVDNNSDLLFWKIALPVMAVLIPIFMFDDVQKAIRYIRRRMESRRISRTAG